MEYSIKLAEWVKDDQVFHYKNIYMVLKCFILPEKHFKANFFFLYYRVSTINFGHFVFCYFSASKAPRIKMLVIFAKPT